jgi:hypothetical protein
MAGSCSTPTRPQTGGGWAQSSSPESWSKSPYHCTCSPDRICPAARLPEGWGRGLHGLCQGDTVKVEPSWPGQPSKEVSSLSSSNLFHSDMGNHSFHSDMGNLSAFVRLAYFDGLCIHSPGGLDKYPSPATSSGPWGREWTSSAELTCFSPPATTSWADVFYASQGRSGSLPVAYFLCHLPM